MNTSDLLGTTPESDPSTLDERRRLLRRCGYAGVGVFAVWLIQPILVTALAGAEEGTVAALEEAPWVGATEAVTFSAIGGLLLVLVLGVRRLVAAGGRNTGSLASEAGHVLGLVAAAAWFWAAAQSLSLYTSVGAGLADVSADPQIQGAALQATSIGITAAVIVFALGASGWYVMVATTGRRTGLVRTPLAVVLVLLAATPAYQLAVPFAAPWGLLGPVLGSLVLGVAFLLAARR